MAGEAETQPEARLFGLADRLIEAWALAGGAVLCAVVAMSVVSVATSAAIGAPLPGDFELVQMGVAVAVFCFLPYCQSSGANVTADIFTAGASPRTVSTLSALWSLFAALFAIVLSWRMAAGMGDYMRYAETTAILQIPHWIAFIPILVSLALLVLASVLTFVRAWRARRSA